MELTSLKYLQNRKELKFKLKTEYKIGNTKQKMNKKKGRETGLTWLTWTLHGHHSPANGPRPFTPSLQTHTKWTKPSSSSSSSASTGG
jgi:hypothetical protein